MMGTSRSATAPMRLIPPMITKPHCKRDDESHDVFRNSDLALEGQRPSDWPASCCRCRKVQQKRRKRQKSAPEYLANHLKRSPFLCSTWGRRRSMPSSYFSRYFTPRRASAYLVAMPTNPHIHIQKMAPGPPVNRAVATPPIFPFPTVAARAVDSAAKGETSPSSFFFPIFLPMKPAKISFIPSAESSELDESGFDRQPESDEEQDGDHDGPHVAGG